MQRPSRRRWVIAAALFITGGINYVDRTNLSIAAPFLSADIKLDAVHVGWLFSAFGWAYAAAQIPAGWLLDRTRPAILYSVIVCLWSLATMCVGFVGSFSAFIVCRVAVGIFESPSYLINNRIVTSWFPENERGRAIAFYTSAQYIGVALLTSPLVWIAANFGWRLVFVFTGLVGLLWSIVWVKYRDPVHFGGTNAAELRLISSGGGITDLGDRIAANRNVQTRRQTIADLSVVLGRKKLWGLYMGQFALGSTQSFFFTWFPTYLIEFRHVSIVHAGIIASVSFTAGLLGVLCGGFLSDLMLRRGFGIDLARKVPVVGGLMFSTIIVGANYTLNESLIAVFFSIAFFANGLASITWSLVSTIAPERLIGLTSSVFNVSGWCSAIVTPILIGYLVERDFGWALLFVGFMAVGGTLSYTFLVSRIERISG